MASAEVSRRQQGPDLLPVGAHPGAARRDALPAGRADQAPSPRDRHAAGATDGREAGVRIRHRAPDVACAVTLVGPSGLLVETAEPVWAPAPGQAAVLYDGDECLGGGRIAHRDAAKAA